MLRRTIAVVGAMSASLAQAQDAASAPYLASVTADNVYVRSGPSVQSSYPFSRVSRGDAVRVLEESFGWARIETSGRAFDDDVAFISADRRVDVAPDGLSVRATARTEVRAPNIGVDGGPDHSWKAIGTLEPGDQAALIDTIAGERETVYRIKMPETSEGWINSSFLHAMTSEEIAAWEAAAIAPAAPADITVVPLPTPTDPAAEAIFIPSEEGASEPGVAVTVAPQPVNPEAVARAAANAAREARRATWSDLESVWNGIRATLRDQAELDALRGRYLDFATSAEGDKVLARRANARAEQLRIAMEAQSQMAELGRIKDEVCGESDAIAAVARAIEARSDYTAVGVLNASMVYDGTTLPLLYRLQNPSSGQAIAYIVPGDDFQLSTMLGTLLGIRGTAEFDEALKVNLLTPRTIDMLTPKQPAETVVEETAVEVTPAETVVEEATVVVEPTATAPAAAEPATTAPAAPATEPTPVEPEPEKP